MSKRKQWRTILLATLACTLVAGLCACGGGSTASEDKAPAKESKDGFDKATNHPLTIGGVTYSIPNYYELNEDEDQKKTYYAEAGESVAMLMVSEAEFKKDAEFNQGFREGFAEALYDDAGSELVESDLDLTIGGMPAMRVIFTTKVEDYDLTCYCYVFCNEDMHTLSSIMLGQSDNTEFDYTADFDKIAQSAKPEKKPKVSKSFKKTMDGYEEFFDDYVKFMKKYQKSDDTLRMLSDFTDYMNKYQEVMSDMPYLLMKSSVALNFT